MSFRRLCVVALAALTLGCGDERPQLSVATEGTSFALEMVPNAPAAAAYIPYTITNRGDKAAFVSACGAQPVIVVERMSEGRWQSYTSGFCIAILPMAPMEIAAGQSQGGLAVVSEAGHYRLRVPYAVDAGRTQPFDAISGNFDVH